MALSNHRHYISSTDEDLERAAGFMKIKSRENADERERYLGASAALYALAWNELKDEKDFFAVWTAIIREQDEWQDDGLA